MERKQKIEILIAILIILLLVGLVWWLLRPASDETAVIIDEDGNAQQFDSLPPLDLTDVEEDASTIARTFVERFGSFSNHSEYENIDAVMSLATASVQDRLEELADRALADTGDVYYGVSTYVLSIEQIEVSDVREVLEILTQREESFETPENTSIKTQTIELTMVKSGEEWLVDDFEWID